MADIDGNNAPQLVFLGEGSSFIEMRDSLFGDLQSNLTFNLNTTPIDLAF